MIMHKLSKYILISLGLILTYSCEDYLEKPESSGLSRETVFTTMEDAEKILAGAYTFSPWGFVNTQQGPLSYTFGGFFSRTTNYCDESDNAYPPAYHNPLYNEGKLTSNENEVFLEDKWTFNFQAIRSCYLFLENVDKVKNYQTVDEELIKIRKAEAKAFIAHKYYEMLKRYGGMPWVPGYTNLNETYSYKRMSVTATIDTIVRLFDEAIPDLPAVHPPGGFGRINKVAAMGMKANTLLWSASSLFNPPDNTSFYPTFGYQEYLKHENYDPNRWVIAAQAYKTVIETALANGYAIVNTGNPDKDYTTATKGFPVKDGNTEIIWGTRIFDSYAKNEGKNQTKPYSKSNFPGSDGCYIIPLQNIIDLFELKNGSFQAPDHYNTSKPYDNLDRRFHQSILYHGAPIGPFTMDMLPGGDNNGGDAGEFYTGYYLGKFLDRLNASDQGPMPDSFWPYLRLAEMYLAYAEALAESNYEANKSEILNAVNIIRRRAGQPNLEDTPQFIDSKEHVLSRIKRERAIELLFEEHRYLDLKRWKMGDVIGGTMYRIDVSGTASNPVFQRVFFENRVFTDKWYLYPIPDNEIRKAPGLIQNPGW